MRDLVTDFWAHRDLLVMLARQDYKSRYRSASLGLLWAVVLPLLQGIVIAVVFTHLTGGGRTSSFLPYVISGVTAYGFVSSSLTSASTAIVDSGAIAGRLYFPRLVLPMITPTANLPGLSIGLGIAVVVSLVAGATPGFWLLLLPAAVALMWLLVVTAGALLTMLHVYSRDVRYVVQAVTMVLFYATPIIYMLDSADGTRGLPDGLRPYVLANPVTGVVQLFRQALIGHADHVGTAVTVTAAWIGCLLAATLFAYCRYERVACDRL